MHGSVDDWARLLCHQNLIDAAATTDPGDAAGVERLRRDHDAVLVGLALDLAAARRKAAVKWPTRAIIADPEGVEMATSALAGAHKARRLGEHGDAITDLCCGIGGDAMALVDAGLTVHAVDWSGVRAWMCAQNAGCETSARDVAEVRIDGLFHLDPARRSGGRRTWRYDELQPGPEVIARLARGSGAIKLGPGVDLDELPDGEIEMISEHGTLTQAVLWTGDLARHARTATVLPAGTSIHGAPGDAAIKSPGRFVHTVDPSVERAQLMGELAGRLGCASVHPRLGLLTSDAPIESPFVSSFELLERMGWHERRVAAWLRDHDGGIVEVKTRGKAVDPDQVQRRLRGRGSTAYTVFVLRFDRRVEALIARRG